MKLDPRSANCGGHILTRDLRNLPGTSAGQHRNECDHEAIVTPGKFAAPDSKAAGPFTVESLSPHRVLGVDENDELIDTVRDGRGEYGAKQSFPQMILDNLKVAGVQRAHKEDRIAFTALTPWPGDLVCAEEFAKLGRIPVLKARMNADLHMAEDLKNTGKGNLFVIFGEPA